jgi:hypothetical protein
VLGDEALETRPNIWSLIPRLAGRSFLFTFYSILYFSGSAYAQSVTLAWDANSEPHLAGYNVYRSRESGIFGGSPINGTSLITTTSFTDSTVTDGIYYYVVTAVGTGGEMSDYSDQVQANLDMALTGTEEPQPDGPSVLAATVTTSESLQGPPRKPKNLRRGKK